MIEINLLPEELRNKVVKVKKPEVVVNSNSLELKHFILLIPLIFGILICIQLSVGILGITRAAQLQALNAKWKSLEPERKAMQESGSRYSSVSEDAQGLRQLLRDRVIWSEKLNRLSADLPPGVWFEIISVNPIELSLQAAVISLSKDDMSLIKQLIDNLKNDPVFIKDFNTLELGQAVKKTIGSYEITEFTLGATLKTK